jgi:TolA-binding protein
LDLLPNRFSESQQAMSRQPPIDNPKLTQLEKQLASLTTRIETQQQTYTVQFKTLENQLKTLQQHANKQQVVWTAIKPHHRKPPVVGYKTQTHRPAKTKTAPRKPSVHSRITPKVSAPSFTLASIDHWGDKTQAVLRHQGQLYTLTIGSKLLGWTVTEFPDTSDGVYVTNRHGQRRLLALD